MDRSATVELDRLQSLFEEQRCRFYERLHSFADNDGPARFGSMEEFGSTAAPAAALATTLGGGGGGGSVSFSGSVSYSPPRAVTEHYVSMAHAGLMGVTEIHHPPHWE